MEQLGPPYPLIREGLDRGTIIPVLGSGASLAVGTAGSPPTAGELASHLAEKIGFPDGETQDLTKVAQYYSVVAGRPDLDSELHTIFARQYAHLALHTFLASVEAPMLIVTTNYDSLIEQALVKRSRAFDVVVHTTDPDFGERVLWWPSGQATPRDSAPNKLDIDLTARTVVYKMHGSVDPFKAGRDQYVITEDDYIDFLARMTRNKAIPAMFAEPFQTRRFLFLGYGLRDWNLRVVLSRIERDLRRPHKKIKSWAVQYQPSALEKRFWQERGVEVYDMRLDDFVAELTSVTAAVS